MTRRASLMREIRERRSGRGAGCRVGGRLILRQEVCLVVDWRIILLIRRGRSHKPVVVGHAPGLRQVAEVLGSGIGFPGDRVLAKGGVEYLADSLVRGNVVISDLTVRIKFESRRKR